MGTLDWILNKVDENLKTLQWDADDVERYDIEEDKIGQFVFTDDTRPFRLYDLSHELKNLPSRIHDRGESYHMSHIS